MILVPEIYCDNTNKDTKKSKLKAKRTSKKFNYCERVSFILSVALMAWF